MYDLFNIFEYPLNVEIKDSNSVKSILEKLLEDKTTNHLILFATDTYSEIAPKGVNGNQCTKDTEMKFAVLKALSKEYNDGFFIIQPRVCKSLVEQKNRTKKSAEVFTPTWICNKMNNICDIEWFNNEFQDKKVFDACTEDFVHNGIFNKEIDEDGQHKWVSNPNRIIFSPKSSWETYVKSTRLEITCGEAPFIVSRYDATTGEQLDVKDRIGILDRKLRVINENVEDKKPWFNAVCDAYKSVYGYEFQGDNLLIARINLLLTFVEYYMDRWGIRPTDNEIDNIVEIITWNFWQMDGLTYVVPYGEVSTDSNQTTFDFFANSKSFSTDLCKIRDWHPENNKEYKEIKFKSLVRT